MCFKVFISVLFIIPILFADDLEKEKWISLFNGKDLSGWEVFVRGQEPLKDAQNYFQVHKGNMHFYKDVEAGDKVEWAVIQSKESFTHYKLRFEYKWGPKRFAPRDKVKKDSGLLIHCYEADRSKWLSRGAWPNSVECQIQETDTGDLHLVGTKASVNVGGELFKRDNRQFPRFSQKPGQKLERVKRVLRESQVDELYKWNQVEAEVLGDKASFWVNGRLVMAVTDMKKPFELNGQVIWQTLDYGKIAFQCEGAEILYKNIEILPLSECLEAKK
ncbi:MAG: DUF1080 domain-containing protein [Lentisphaeraceae bacterium]|nr:DUF1080 domain-containing protein [Lentisphaeraceae bacterium]